MFPNDLCHFSHLCHFVRWTNVSGAIACIANPNVRFQDAQVVWEFQGYLLQLGNRDEKAKRKECGRFILNTDKSFEQ